MDTDKNSNTLEKKLKILGQKIRIDILKRLKKSNNPLSFSKLQKEVLVDNPTSVNFSFHLNTLKQSDLISSSEDGYFINNLGKQILNNILSIEQILANKNKVRMIRTSKYSKEKFDIKKIEEYLVNEGELDIYLARQIAHEVEQRFSKTNIEYLTAPLMREYINAILLENDLEEVRHRLTRLGTPPFEVYKLFDSDHVKITPNKFINRLGSDVSEQFLLLNLLPKNLADLYLSGEIALLNLNYWSLRPLSLYLNTKYIMSLLFRRYPLLSKKMEKSRDYSYLLLKFFNFLYQLRQFFSEDLLLGEFDNQFLSKFDLPEHKLYFFDLLAFQIFRFNNFLDDNKIHLSLEFSSTKESFNEGSLQFKINNNTLNSLIKQNDNHNKPLILFDYSKIIQSDLENNSVKNYLSKLFEQNLIFYHKTSFDLLNSTIIKIKNPKENRIILDKILVNLHMISVESNHNDELFFELLQEKLVSIFKLFRFKESLVRKKLKFLKEWNSITSQVFEKSEAKIFNQAVKSISFFGLNKAILNHCGIELDRTKKSTTFALKILSLMKKIIEEQNEKENDYYILSQPHKDLYLKDSWYNGITLNSEKINSYSPKLIRKNSSLSLDKKIDLFKKFEPILNGGIVFKSHFNSNDISLMKVFKKLLDSKISAFTLNCSV
ncbi:MAG: anaerobic ribonucleoside-triphosphate reductase [Promethearchaeota archaeon]